MTEREKVETWGDADYGADSSQVAEKLASGVTSICSYLSNGVSSVALICR